MHTQICTYLQATAPMEQAPTVQDLIKKYCISPTLLNNQCSDEHLSSIALFLDWRTTAPHLGLSATDIDDIETEGRNNAQKRFQTLQKWRMKFGYTANYKNLIRSLHKIGNTEHAERVCQLLQPQGMIYCIYCARSLTSHYISV